MISDHIQSNVDPEDAAGWLVDGFGTAHALAPNSMIGRALENQIVVLSGSVSREHARLEGVDSVWHIRDERSRNGTFVEDSRLNARTALPAKARVRIGHVPLWFLNEVRYQPKSSSAVTQTAEGGLTRYTFTHNGTELCIVGSGNDATIGGSLLTRPEGTTQWTDVGLAPLEFQLLRALAARAVEETSSPATVKGTIPTRQLARDLPFQTKYANEENVRQVVRRVRQVLEESGVIGVLGAAPGRGYYLVCSVKNAK